MSDLLSFEFNPPNLSSKFTYILIWLKLTILLSLPCHSKSMQLVQRMEKLDKKRSHCGQMFRKIQTSFEILEQEDFPCLQCSAELHSQLGKVVLGQQGRLMTSIRKKRYDLLIWITAARLFWPVFLQRKQHR